MLKVNMALPEPAKTNFEPFQLRAIEQVGSEPTLIPSSERYLETDEAIQAQRERLSAKAQLYSTIGALACIGATYASQENGNILAATSFGSLSALALSLPGTEYALRLRDRFKNRSQD